VRFACHAAPGRLEITLTPEHGAPFRWDAASKQLEVALPVLESKPVQVALSP
jgi:hypothetical protein